MLQTARDVCFSTLAVDQTHRPIIGSRTTFNRAPKIHIARREARPRKLFADALSHQSGSHEQNFVCHSDVQAM